MCSLFCLVLGGTFVDCSAADCCVFSGYVCMDWPIFSWPCIHGLPCLLVAMYCGLFCLLVAMYVWIILPSRGHVYVDCPAFSWPCMLDCSAFSWPCVCVACSDVLDLRGLILLPFHGHVWIVLFSLGHVWTVLLLRGHVYARCSAFSKTSVNCSPMCRP